MLFDLQLLAVFLHFFKNEQFFSDVNSFFEQKIEKGFCPFFHERSVSNILWRCVAMWRSSYEKDETARKVIQEGLNELLDLLNEKDKAFAIYRFGLQGQQPHSRKETAAHFSIPLEKMIPYECTVRHRMGLRPPAIRSIEVLQNFLDS